MNKVVLVTGASGFIGSNLIEKLLREGFEVVGYSRTFPLRMKIGSFYNGVYHHVEGDILNIQLLKKSIAQHKPTIVFHFAGQPLTNVVLNLKDNFEINVQGTENVLESLKGCPFIEKIVITSSIYANEYSIKNKEKKKGDKNELSYTFSKSMMEMLALKYKNEYDLPITIIRLGNIYGPFDNNYERIIPYSIISCLKGKKIKILTDGQQVKSFLFIKDLTTVFMRILSSTITNFESEGILRAESNMRVTVLNLAIKICGIFNLAPEETIIILNKECKDSIVLPVDGIPNLIKLEFETSLDWGLKKTIQWYKNNTIAYYG